MLLGVRPILPPAGKLIRPLGYFAGKRRGKESPSRGRWRGSSTTPAVWFLEHESPRSATARSCHMLRHTAEIRAVDERVLGYERRDRPASRNFTAPCRIPRHATRCMPGCLRDVAACDWRRRQLPREKRGNRGSCGEVAVPRSVTFFTKCDLWSTAGLVDSVKPHQGIEKEKTWAGAASLSRRAGSSSRGRDHRTVSSRVRDLGRDAAWPLCFRPRMGGPAAIARRNRGVLRLGGCHQLRMHSRWIFTALLLSTRLHAQVVVVYRFRFH